MPKGFLLPPKLQPGDWKYLEAFSTISASRTMGFNSPNPLSIVEVRSYLEAFTDISGLEGRKHFLHLMLRLDSCWLEAVSKSS